MSHGNKREWWFAASRVYRAVVTKMRPVSSARTTLSKPVLAACTRHDATYKQCAQRIRTELKGDIDQAPPSPEADFGPINRWSASGASLRRMPQTQLKKSAVSCVGRQTPPGSLNRDEEWTAAARFFKAPTDWTTRQTGTPVTSYLARHAAPSLPVVCAGLSCRRPLKQNWKSVTPMHSASEARPPNPDRRQRRRGSPSPSYGILSLRCSGTPGFSLLPRSTVHPQECESMRYYMASPALTGLANVTGGQPGSETPGSYIGRQGTNGECS